MDVEVAYLQEAVELLEKANAGLEPELLPADAARELLQAYVRARRLVDFGVVALTRKVNDVAEVARVTGISMGKAKETVNTGKVLGSCPS
jgi:hypothetical protein